MSHKKTKDFYIELAQSRNHNIIVFQNNETPASGTLTIQCNTCGIEFTTTAKSYVNARKTGCPNCKRIATSKQWKGKTRSLTPEQAAKKDSIRAYKQKTRLEKAQQYASLKNREDLELFLKQENNAYTLFILECIKNPVQSDRVEEHHIIPLHAGGPNVEWNLISLTPETHFEAHRIRAEVYKETGDINAFRLRGEQSVDLIARRIAATRSGDNTRKQEGSGIYAPGVSSKGGKIGGRVKSVKKDLGHKTKMSNQVKELLDRGSTWDHVNTNCSVTIPAKAVHTLPQLVNILVKALPLGVDREQLTKANMTTVTSNIARVIKGQRPTAYGWKLVSENLV
jgi:RNA polymerase subunit RPABC4/transcription elongation factor Spt4